LALGMTLRLWQAFALLSQQLEVNLDSLGGVELLGNVPGTIK
jgi:hypothetical protein